MPVTLAMTARGESAEMPLGRRTFERCSFSSIETTKMASVGGWLMGGVQEKEIRSQLADRQDLIADGEVHFHFRRVAAAIPRVG